MSTFQADAVRCVWSGYPANGCSCRSNIPRRVVSAAWRRELDRRRVRADRFFHFAWQDGVWLAYGLKDGRVRGVYCPAHSAERDERSLVADPRAEEPPRELALTA